VNRAAIERMVAELARARKKTCGRPMRGRAAPRAAGKKAVCLTQFFKLTPADEKSGVIERRSSSNRSS
jgi:hypothetical protein